MPKLTPEQALQNLFLAARQVSKATATIQETMDSTKEQVVAQIEAEKANIISVIVK